MVTETSGLELLVTKLLAVRPLLVGNEDCVTYATVAVEHPLVRADTETLLDAEGDGLITGEDDEILLGTGVGEGNDVSVPKILLAEILGLLLSDDSLLDEGSILSVGKLVIVYTTLTVAGIDWVSVAITESEALIEKVGADEIVLINEVSAE